MVSILRVDKVESIQMSLRTPTHHLSISATGLLHRSNGERVENARVIMWLPDPNSVNADILTVIMNYIYGAKGYNPVTGFQTPDALHLTLNEGIVGNQTREIIIAFQLFSGLRNNNDNINLIPNFDIE